MKFRSVLLPAIFLFTGAFCAAAPVPGEVIVTFKTGESLDGSRARLRAKALAYARHYRKVSEASGRQTGLVRVPGMSTERLVRLLSADPAVESVEPNHLRRVTATPNDTHFTTLWGLQNTGQNINGITGTPGADIKFIPAWKMARPPGGETVIAVIDSGIDRHHPDLAPSLWTNTGEIPFNGIDDDGNCWVDDVHGYGFAKDDATLWDPTGHGTHVAGTAAAAGYNGLGVIGVNPRARIMALRISDDAGEMPTSAVIEALDYVIAMKARGVNIVAINASYVGDDFSPAEYAAIQAAGNAGIILCASAGNEGWSNDTIPAYPANYDLPNIITVAASTQRDGLSAFSNFSPTLVDLAAPGDNIRSTEPATLNGWVIYDGFAYNGSPLRHTGTGTGIAGTLYDCGQGRPVDFPAAVAGNIALVSRGGITAVEKTRNAMAAGAVAVVISNTDGTAYSDSLGNDGSWIPALAVSQVVGTVLRTSLPASVTFTVNRTAAYGYRNGTSMACPHVTAAVALAAMNFPAETVAQRVQRVLGNADLKLPLLGKVATGARLNLLRTIDTDGNGLPDWWESDHFNHLTGTDPAGDSDGDGMSDLAEFLAGTDPGDAGSLLKILGGTRATADGDFTLRWSSVPGKMYQVLYSGDLSPGSWRDDLPGSLLTTPSGQTESIYTDETGGGVLRRFYRVELVDP